MTIEESIKSSLRFLIYPLAVMFTQEGTISAKTGSFKYHMLAWLYGADEAEPVHDGWIYPDKEN